MRSVAVALAILLAGCATPVDEDDTFDPADGTPRPPRYLRYTDCEEIFTIFPAPLDAIALPDGFTAAPLLGQGPAAVFVHGWSCAGARDGRNASQEPFNEIAIGLSVLPPEDLAAENATFHAILLGLSTNSTLGANAYRTWNVTAEHGTPTFTWTPNALGGTGTLAGTAGARAVGIRFNAGGLNNPEEEGLARMFLLQDGNLSAAYDIAWIEAAGIQGQATSMVPLPGAPTPGPGLGYYYSSNKDRYLMTPVRLA